ncbi:calcium channel flower homolog [Saccostrea echinata]|uniref:calcium channel flower homolog n=1 Tax=Saccostrea echinata TaxID=191078 RepID=UPI002A823B12|nr:calcium channel flower homolog [Saccostrea echinata]
MQSNTRDGQQKGGIVDTWWYKYLLSGVGTLGGLLAILFGLVACITFTAMCLLAGVLQMVAGFVVVLLEAPCCCQFVEFADKISSFSDKRPPWQKAVLYCLLGLVPIASCIEAWTILGAGLVFIAGALYGLKAIGKKGDRESMMAVASGADLEMKVQLIDNEEKTELPNSAVL